MPAGLRKALRASWHWAAPAGYAPWASRQLSPTVYFWARTMVVICLVTNLKALLTGSLHECGFQLAHTSPYFIISAGSFGVKGLGHWQVWMRSVPIAHAAGYFWMSLVPRHVLRMWRASVEDWIDFVYQVILTASFEQNPLPYMLVTRLLLACCYALALKNLGCVAHPWRDALVTHGVALLVTTGVRTYQLWSFFKWQSTQSHAVTIVGGGDSKNAAVVAEAEAPGMRDGKAAALKLGVGEESAAAGSGDLGTAGARRRVPGPAAAARKASAAHSAPTAHGLALEEIAGYTQVIPRHTAVIKVNNVDPSQLRPGFPDRMASCLATGAPSTTVLSVAVRKGCVIATLNLATLDSSTAPLDTTLDATGVPDALLQALAEELRDLSLPDGSSVMIQTSNAVLQYLWSSASEQFVLASEHQAAPAAASDVAALQRQAAECRVVRDVPAVQCLPATSSQPLVLPLQLQLPAYRRLLGWQPDPVNTPIPEAPAHTPTTSARPVDQAGDASHQSEVSHLPDVQLVVVSPKLGPLPVSLAVESLERLGAVHTLDTAGGTLDIVKVAVEVSVHVGAPTQPLGLELQLFLKGAGEAPMDILCAQCPLVVLPDTWHTAAEELQDHVEQLGGVRATHLLPTPTGDSVGPSSPGAPTAGGATALVADLATWLSHGAQAGGALPGNEKMVVLGQLQRALLLHMVCNGLEEVAQCMVTLMTGWGVNGNGQHSDGVTGPLAETAGWFRDATSRADGLDRKQQGAGSLLHAAMQSGQPAVLDRVLRWGRLYGGRQWQWPWSLADQHGHTPLHLAATHPDPSVCAALLATLTRMLTPNGVLAAREAWAQATGPLGVTPAQLFASQHPRVDLSKAWDSADRTEVAPGSGAPAAAPEEPSTAGDDRVPGRGVRRSHSDRPQDCSAVARPGDRTSLSWVQALRQAWLWKPDEEYNTWVDQQVRNLVYFWAQAVSMCAVAAIVRACTAGSGPAPPLVLFMHNLPYVSIAASALGKKCLGSWQFWLYLAPWATAAVHLYIHATYHISALSLRSIWEVLGTNGCNILYMSLLTAVGEQAPMPYVLFSRMAMTYFHGKAMTCLPQVRHPWAVACSTNATAVLVTTVIRMLQVKAFHSQRKKRRCSVCGVAPCAAATLEHALGRARTPLGHTSRGPPTHGL